MYNYKPFIINYKLTRNDTSSKFKLLFIEA